MVVNRYAHYLLRFILTYHELIEVLFHVAGFYQVEFRSFIFRTDLIFFVQDLLGLAHATLADMRVYAGDHYRNFFFLLAAKRANYFCHIKNGVSAGLISNPMFTK